MLFSSFVEEQMEVKHNVEIQQMLNLCMHGKNSD